MCAKTYFTVRAMSSHFPLNDKLVCLFNRESEIKGEKEKERERNRKRAL